LPHKFSYMDAILIHNHFESPNTCDTKYLKKWQKKISFIQLQVFFLVGML
jgi:hypothetical protein